MQLHWLDWTRLRDQGQQCRSHRCPRPERQQRLPSQPGLITQLRPRTSRAPLIKHQHVVVEHGSEHLLETVTQNSTVIQTSHR